MCLLSCQLAGLRGEGWLITAQPKAVDSKAQRTCLCPPPQGKRTPGYLCACFLAIQRARGERNGQAEAAMPKAVPPKVL